MKTHLYIATFCLLFAGCSDAATDEPNACPEGSSRNPVTGNCDAASANNQNNTSTADTGTGSSNNNTPEPDTGTTPTPDMATGADMGTPPRDLGTPAKDMGPPPEELVRFVAIGDQGTGSDTQRKVGAAIGTVCQSLGGCDFGLLLGDNFYDTGVSSVDDSLFMSMFDIPYGSLGFPFYAVLGNHDLGGSGLGLDLDQNKAAYQIDYGTMNPMWIMPARYYDFSVGPLWFAALDSTAIFWGNDDDQRQDLPNMLNNAGNRWKIAFGHHPYYSNGPHGNAGEYEPPLGFLAPLANGEHVRAFMDDHICGNFDFYICGHDHSRQDLVPTCNGTQFIVSGAGAKTTDLDPSRNATHFESDLEGFLLVEATDTRFTIRFYDEDGAMNHERTVTR